MTVSLVQDIKYRGCYLSEQRHRGGEDLGDQNQGRRPRSAPSRHQITPEGACISARRRPSAVQTRRARGSGAGTVAGTAG